MPSKITNFNYYVNSGTSTYANGGSGGTRGTGGVAGNGGNENNASAGIQDLLVMVAEEK